MEMPCLVKGVLLAVHRRDGRGCVEAVEMGAAYHVGLS
jgi:hypothetical protein